MTNERDPIVLLLLFLEPHQRRPDFDLRLPLTHWTPDLVFDGCSVTHSLVFCTARVLFLGCITLSAKRRLCMPLPSENGTVCGHSLNISNGCSRSRFYWSQSGAYGEDVPCSWRDCIWHGLNKMQKHWKWRLPFIFLSCEWSVLHLAPFLFITATWPTRNKF